MNWKLGLFALLSSTAVFAQTTNDTLKTGEKEIEAVKIIAKKPTVETKVDRTVFNVANSSILAGNTTWDVLRMTPLVSIDNNDVVKSEGESVTVYINDRKSIFTGKELKEYLKAIPADNLMKIEVITNPSARYETAGQVINVVLKKRDDEGIKGSVSLNNRQKIKNNQYSNANVNYHKNKFTQTLSGSFGHNTNVSTINTESTIFKDNEKRNVSMDSESDGKHGSFSSTSEYELNDKNSIGIIGEFFQSNSMSNNNSIGEITKEGIPYNMYTMAQTDDSRYGNLSGNIFYKYYDKVKNRIFDVNIGSNYNTDKGDRHYLQEQAIDPKTVTNRVVENSLLRNYYLKLDYSQSIDTLGSSIEVGTKFDFNNNFSPIDYYGFVKNANEESVNLFNRFKYSDNLNSVYANYSTKLFKKLETRIGLRYEYMTYKLNQISTHQEKKESYGKLLPNILLKYTFTPNFNISSSYNSSLWRPWYSEFNPFELPTSDGNFYRGNMDLNPNPYHRFNMKFGVYKKYFLSLGYSFTTQDYWEDFLQDGDRLISLPNNFTGKSVTYSANFNTNQTFFSNKLNVNLTAGIVYMDNSDFNNKNGLKANSYLTNFTGSTNISYTNLFNKNINVSLFVGAYQNNQGNMVANRTNIYDNISITKIFSSVGMEASIQANNVFQKPVFDVTRYSQMGVFKTFNKSDFRGISFTLTKRFGNQKVKENSKTDVEKNQGGGK